MTEVCFCGSLSTMLKAVHNKAAIYHGLFGKVVYLFLPLHLGNLQNGVFSEARLNQVHSMMKDDWREGLLYTKREQKKAISRLEDVKRRMEKGEKIRIWYSDSAEDLCALYYLISELNGISGEITCINKNSRRVPYSCKTTGFGALKYTELLHYLPAERPIEESERHWIEETWKGLCSQGWNLRANVNGELVGVPESFYDSGIRAFIPRSGGFKSSRVEGDYLTSIPSGMDPNIVEWRLSVILHSSEFETVGEPRALPEGSYCLMMDRLTFRCTDWTGESLLGGRA